MTKWQYRIIVRNGPKGDMSWVDKSIQGNGEEVLNSMGADGWELLTILPIAGHQPDGVTKFIHYVFKRPLM